MCVIVLRGRLLGCAAFVVRCAIRAFLLREHAGIQIAEGRVASERMLAEVRGSDTLIGCAICGGGRVGDSVL